MMEIKANNPQLKSWIEVKTDSDFPIQNLPFGIYANDKTPHHACTAIGDKIFDLHTAHQLGYFKSIALPEGVFDKPVLNDFIALGKEVTRSLRDRISDLLNTENNELQSNPDHCKQIIKEQSAVHMLLPVHISDYTDFYSGIQHAYNVGVMFRGPENALMPNYKHLPVGYHGRASSICVSGHSFHRPKGQSKPADAPAPVFGPCKNLDFELETAFIVGKTTQMGESVNTELADDYIFGMVLFNDWSARDIQTWEYVPLGPFLAKNFASTMSPWIVTLDALEPFRTDAPKQEPEVLPYLQYKGKKSFDINLDVYLHPKDGQATQISASNFKYMYWTIEQQLAHHTVNGCNINVGDVMASGTISGPESSQYGSMLELTWRGEKPITLNDGSQRKFLNDYDTVIIKGWCKNKDVRIGFGECKAQALPAKD